MTSPSAGRPSRSTDACTSCLAGGPVDRPSRPPESSALWKCLWSTWRSTGQRACSLYSAPVKRVVDWPESRCSLDPGSIDWAVNWRHNGHKYDRWPVDRKGKNAFSWLPTGRFCGGYKYPTFELVLNNNFKSKISIFQQVFKRVFVPKISSLFAFKGLKKSKKNRIFGIFVLILSYSSCFSKYFSLCFLFSKLFIFSHLSYHIYPIY